MKKTNESGRSMVEMLGVLAIIGVLSVGGIAGYTMAMNRYRANEAIDLANKYAVVAYSAAQTHKLMGRTGTVEIPEFADTGLVVMTGSTYNGFKIGKAAVNLSDNGTAADTVTISITFDNARVCNAAAATLGTTCNANAVSYVFTQS